MDSVRPLLLALAVVAALCAPARAQDPTDPAARRAAAEGRLVRGMTELFLGNDTTAVRQLEHALRLAPGDAAVLDALAEANERMGDTPAALFHAEAAARAAPERPSAHLRLGRLQAAAGLPDAAEASLETARRLAPADPEPLVALASLYAAQRRADAEREALEALVRLVETPDARLRLANLYAAAGDTPRALALLDAAVRLSPGDADVRGRRAALAGTPTPTRPAAPVASTAPAGDAPVGDVDALRARVDAEPGDLAAWTRLLDLLAASNDPRGASAADDAVLFFPASPTVLAPAAEIYRSSGRAADADAAARAGLAALDSLGDRAPEGADALRTRLRRATDG